MHTKARFTRKQKYALGQLLFAADCEIYDNDRIDGYKVISVPRAESLGIHPLTMRALRIRKAVYHRGILGARPMYENQAVLDIAVEEALKIARRKLTDHFVALNNMITDTPPHLLTEHPLYSWIMVRIDWLLDMCEGLDE